VIWVKPKDYVVVETSGTGGEGEGVLSIKQILSKENIKGLKREGRWPAAFTAEDDAMQSSGVSNARNARGGDVVVDDLMPGYEYQEEEEEEGEYYEEETA
jgi:hypothetical protein